MNLGGGVRLVRAKVGQCLIVSGPPLTLIDTGRPGSAGRIARALRKLGSKIEDIEQIVITHPHHDHIGSAAEIQRVSGARLFIHPADRAVAQGEKPPYPYGDDGIAASITLPARSRLDQWIRFEPVRCDELIEDGGTIPGGMVAVETPGHTPGHVSILIPEIELIHVGDALWNILRLRRAPLMFNTDAPRADLSVKRLGDLDGYRRATFGHGPPIFRGARRRIRRAGT